MKCRQYLFCVLAVTAGAVVGCSRQPPAAPVGEAPDPVASSKALEQGTGNMVLQGGVPMPSEEDRARIMRRPAGQQSGSVLPGP